VELRDSIASKKGMQMGRLPEVRKVIAGRLTQWVVRLLSKAHVTPNALTLVGFLLTVGAAVLIGTGHLFAAGFLVLIAGFFDILDGALARSTNQVTRFGGILDSTLDRLAEAALLLGLLAVYVREQHFVESLLVGLVLAGSFVVSYVRARAEAAGLECQEGVFTRAERVVVLALGLLLSQFDYVLVAALGIIGVFSFVTVGQRLFYVWRQTRN
jgi:CDP-diacylglycerol--glycerol-3-phosphate 3-phosphatidyltransferase